MFRLNMLAHPVLKVCSTVLMRVGYSYAVARRSLELRLGIGAGRDWEEGASKHSN